MRKALMCAASALAAAALAACSAHSHSNILPAASATHKPLAIGGPSVAQTAAITGSLGGTFAIAPANGDLLIAIGFNAVSPIACAAGWTAIRHVTASYVDAQDCYRVVSGDSAAETPFAGTGSNIGGEIWEVSGQAASGFIDAQIGAESATPGTVTLTFAPAASGDLIVGASAINTKLVGTAPAGFTTDASAAPNGSTGFSDLAAHETNALSGTQSVTWSYSSGTNTHPVTAMMIAIDGSGGPTPTPAPTSTPTPPPTSPPSPTPSPVGGAFSIVQTGVVTSSLGTTLRSAPANGDLLVAIGFDGKSIIGCAANWTLIRHVSASYVEGQSCYRIASADTATETPFAGTSADIAGEIWDLRGQIASGFIDAQTGAEAGPRTVTLSFPPAHNGDIIVGGSAINTKLTGITPTGFVTDSSSDPAGTSGFSDLAAHHAGAASGTQSVTWAYNSTTDTHPVTAVMVAVAGSSGSVSPTPSPSPSASVDWLTMGYDLKRTGYNPNEKTIGTGNVGGVHSVWTHNVGGEIGEPVYAANVTINGVATNVLYASGSAKEVALNADLGGTPLWTHALSTVTYQCAGSSTVNTFGASGTPAIDRATNRIYVPDGAANVHAFDLSTGAEISGWPISIASPANLNFIYSAVSYNPANKTLYAQTSSTCDINPWFGRITAIDTTTHSILRTFFPAQGASGGGIWGFGGASIDPATNNVYVLAGNGDTTNGGSELAGYSDQIIELSADLSTVIGHFYVSGDQDFGATPLLFQPPGCPLLAAAINKSGHLEIYNASNISAGPVRVVQIGTNTDFADDIGLPAYDPATNMLYVNLPMTSGIYKPGMAAFDVSSCTINAAGTPVWNANFGTDAALVNDDALRSPISIANGVVYVSDYVGSKTYALNAATGAILRTAALSANGVVGPIVVNGHLYTSDISGAINAWVP